MLEPNALVGSVLGHYRLIEQLGAGGMGVVFRARDEQLERDVAIKLLPLATSDEPAARARLLREARTASQLNHPNICTVFDVGEAVPMGGAAPAAGPAVAYLAMELVRGETLRARLTRAALPPDEVVRIGRQLADALAHAHAQGVIHRDFKSANIVLTPEGRAKVLDFGLAKRVRPDVGLETATGAPTVTQAGTVAGTLAYMSPEQLRGQPADARSDVWALGVVLHEMTAGALPFPGETGYEVSAAILQQRPLPLPATVPAALCEVIARCLEKDPSGRFADGGAVQATLDALATGVMPLPTWTAAGPVASRVRRWTSRRPVRLALLGAGALLLVAGAFVGLDVGGLRTRFVTPSGPGAPSPVVKLAVLPFANLTGDPEQEYLSDGVTQEMIAQLGRLHPQGLSVIARTSVMRYKKTDLPIDQIGRELGVDFILEGSARREANRIRISAELIQVRDQTQLWADVYERDLAGILALQNEVAQKVAGALALKLLPAEQAGLAAVRTVNPEAHDAYLKGSHYWYKLTPGDLDTAQRYLELALEKDPSYAPAYAGMALVWAGRNQMALVRPEEAAPKAEEAALRAVALDDTLAEAHYARAVVKTWHVWDIPAADADWTRAIDINPNFPDARAFYSHYLHMMGRREEAMAQIAQALKLDPFNVLLQSLYAMDLLFAGRHGEALVEARKAQRMQPEAPIAATAVLMSLRLTGTPEEVLTAAKAYYSLYGDPAVVQAFDRGYAEGGYPRAARNAAAALAARFRSTYLNPGDVADLYLDAGDRAEALAWLERGVDARDPNMPYIGVMPNYAVLRSEPRFQALLRRIGLPQDPVSRP